MSYAAQFPALTLPTASFAEVVLGMWAMSTRAADAPGKGLGSRPGSEAMLKI